MGDPYWDAYMHGMMMSHYMMMKGMSMKGWDKGSWEEMGKGKGALEADVGKGNAEGKGKPGKGKPGKGKGALEDDAGKGKSEEKAYCETHQKLRKKDLLVRDPFTGALQCRAGFECRDNTSGEPCKFF